MKIALVGGLDRLAPHYRRVAEEAGHVLTVLNAYHAGFDDKLRSNEVVVVLTGMVSHNARNHARDWARSHAIPVIQAHSPGLSAFRGALAGL